MTLRWRTWLIALLLGALPLPASALRDQLTIGVSQFPSSLHPYIDPEVIKGYILGFAMRPITAFDETWQNHCMMCTELPTLENGRVKLEPRADGAPGMAIRLTLRSDLFWDDGTPVTTRDLVFTAHVGADAASGFPNTRTWGRVQRVEIIDEHTAVMHLDEVWSLYDRIPALLPAHIEGPVYDKTGEPGVYVKQNTYNRAPTTPGLFNGPFRIVDYQSGAQVVLERNPAWRGKVPQFKRIVIRAITNTAALQANLLSGDIDFTPEAIGLTIDQVIALKAQQPARFDYVFHASLSYTHIDVQLDNPILADLRVRKALMLGMDRKSIVDRLYGGMADLASAWVPPRDPMFAADLPKFDYDPKAARALLADAGWKPGADGICRNAAGTRLSLTFQTSSGIKLTELVQQVIQDQWKAICVETVIKNEPFRTLFGDTMKKRQYTGLSIYRCVCGISYPARQTLSSEQIPTAANNFSGSNFMDWHNATVDAGIKVTENELDAGKRAAAWAAMQHAYADDLPVLPLYFPTTAVALPKWLHGYLPTGITDYPPLWVENWRTDD